MAKANMHGVSEKEGKSWGKGKFANMPSDVKMNSYPKASEAGPGVLDDTMTGIDKCNKLFFQRTKGPKKPYGIRFFCQYAKRPYSNVFWRRGL
jgi:hypothetical protein